MSATSLTEYAIDQRVQVLWEQVVIACNKVLKHANVHGFGFMDIPDPNVHEMAWMLDNVVCPLLDRLVVSGQFSPESGIKAANIKQYTLHLRVITLALDQQDEEKFNEAVARLEKESMIG